MHSHFPLIMHNVFLLVFQIRIKCVVASEMGILVHIMCFGKVCDKMWIINRGNLDGVDSVTLRKIKTTDTRRESSMSSRKFDKAKEKRDIYECDKEKSEQRVSQLKLKNPKWWLWTEGNHNNLSIQPYHVYKDSMTHRVKHSFKKVMTLGW